MTSIVLGLNQISLAVKKPGLNIYSALRFVQKPLAYNVCIIKYKRLRNYVHFCTHPKTVQITTCRLLGPTLMRGGCSFATRESGAVFQLITLHGVTLMLKLCAEVWA